MVKVDLAKLRELRKSYGYSMGMVAKHLGFKTPQGYFHKETGERAITAAELGTLAALFEVSADDLLIPAPNEGRNSIRRCETMPKKHIAAPLDTIDTLEQKWVRRSTAKPSGTMPRPARQLGVHEKTVGNLVRSGFLQTSPNKRVLVRSAAAYANSNRPKRSTRLNAVGYWN